MFCPACLQKGSHAEGCRNIPTPEQLAFARAEGTKDGAIPRTRTEGDLYATFKGALDAYHAAWKAARAAALQAQDAAKPPRGRWDKGYTIAEQETEGGFLKGR